MTRFLSILCLVVLAFTSAPAFAQTLDLSGMSPEAIARLQAEIERIQAIERDTRFSDVAARGAEAVRAAENAVAKAGDVVKAASDDTGATQVAANGDTTADSAAAQDAGATSGETADDYVRIGSAIGKALAETAREIGMAAAEFAKTPIGTVAVILVAWKLGAGEMLSAFIGFAIGIPWLIAGVGGWWVLFRRMCLVSSREAVPVPGAGDKAGSVKMVEHYWSEHGRDIPQHIENWRIAMFFILLVHIAISMIIIFS